MSQYTIPANVVAGTAAGKRAQSYVSFLKSMTDNDILLLSKSAQDGLSQKSVPQSLIDIDKGMKFNSDGSPNVNLAEFLSFLEQGKKNVEKRSTGSSNRSELNGAPLGGNSGDGSNSSSNQAPIIPPNASVIPPLPPTAMRQYKLLGLNLPGLSDRKKAQSYKDSALLDYQNAISGYTGLKQKGGFPGWAIPMVKNQRNTVQKMRYQGLVASQARNQSSALFNRLKNQFGQQNFSFDGTMWKINNDGDFSKKIFKEPNQNLTKKRLDEANKMMDASLTNDQIEQTIPKLVKSIVDSNARFSDAGIGQKAPNSLPLYAGRWVQKATGRVRILPKASTKYLNPLSFDQRMKYYEARVLNKWNQYVDAEANLLKFQGKQATNWTNTQRNKLKKRLQAKPVYDKAVKWMKTQILAFQAGYPLSKSSRIVLTNAKKSQRIKDMLRILDQDRSDNQEKIRKINQVLMQIFTANAPTTVDTSSAQAVSNYKSLVGAFVTWLNKATGEIGRALFDVAKTQIPNDVDQKTYQEMVEKMDQMKEVWKKRGQLAVQDVTNFMTVAQTPPQTMADFVKTLDDLKTKGNKREQPLGTIQMPPPRKMKFNAFTLPGSVQPVVI